MYVGLGSRAPPPRFVTDPSYGDGMLSHRPLAILPHEPVPS